jgi:hypothetical protein
VGRGGGVLGCGEHQRSGDPADEGHLGYVPGYNAQGVVDKGQIVVAAEITNSLGR